VAFEKFGDLDQLRVVRALDLICRLIPKAMLHVLEAVGVELG
jgi:hypothetical protein